jgi:hypothetical protein
MNSLTTKTTVMEEALRPFHAPAARGLFVYHHRHACGVLVCHLDYDAPDDGAPDETGQPTHRPEAEAMVLISAYAHGQDVEHLLADWVREEIEIATLKAWRVERDEARIDVDACYPDWEGA